MKSLCYKTIDVVAQQDLCIRFRRDSFACSFDDGAKRFDAENGADGLEYIAWLREKISAFPRGFVHAWNEDRVIGQLELRMRSPVLGYANLFYLCPEARGFGWGDALHSYAVDYFRSEGAKTALLCVSTTNVRAIGFYSKHGWKDVGPREDNADVHFYELHL